MLTVRCAFCCQQRLDGWDAAIIDSWPQELNQSFSVVFERRLHIPQFPVYNGGLSGAEDRSHVFDHQLTVHAGLAQELSKRLRVYGIGGVAFEEADFKLE